MKYLFLLSSFLLVQSITAKKVPDPLTRTDPPYWWTGMAEEKLEIAFYGPDIQQFTVALVATNTTISNITLPENRNYIFVEISIHPDQQPGDIKFVFSGKKRKKFEHLYSLKGRENVERTHGISPDDLMYMIFPDRFSNGDPSNDAAPAMAEKTMDRKGLKTRHGGDIQGIINHLDYVQELGVTALWVNPVLENNEPRDSYHGYAATDLYKVDPRFGTNELYKSMVSEGHKRGIKMVWDVVYNHWGDQNWMFLDLPDSSWINWFPEFTRTTYRAEVLVDPYASEYDKKRMSDAWFDNHMPDLNQRDPHLAKYLIQNTIWWIEYAGIDAYRIDTYAYPDQQFMKNLNEAVKKQYPDFFLFGETWVQGSPVQSWFVEESKLNKSYSSALNGVTDFQLYFAITKGLNEPFGWEEGFRRIELTLSHDVLYKDPYSLVTFLDNHDLSRFYSVINKDYDKFKMGMAMLYTLRGIPCVYYGTEILMSNYADPDAKVREDFPGGWAADSTNKFLAAGRTTQENEAFNFCKALGKWRKENAWFGKSKLTQFVPDDNTYVYFRYDEKHSLMCVYNANEKETTVKLSRFKECVRRRKEATDVISGNKIQLGDAVTVPAKGVLIYELISLPEQPGNPFQNPVIEE